MRIFFPFGGGLFTCREVGKRRKRRSIFGPNPENIRVVQNSGSGRTKGDVGCDRMVFAMNSNLVLVELNSTLNK